VTVTPGAISLAHSTVAVSSGSVASGSAVTLTLQAKDANGNNLTVGGETVVFTATSGTSTGTIGGTSDHSDGIYTASFTGVLAGTAMTIGATIGGSAVTWTPLPTVTVTAGRATRLSISVQPTNTVAGAAISPPVIVRALDQAGNVDPQYDGAFSSVVAAIDSGSGTRAATLSGTSKVDAVAGVATFSTLSIDSAGTVYRLRFFYIANPPYYLTDDTSGTFNITPGSVSAAHSLVSISSETVVSGNQVTLTLQARDANGNNLANGGSTVVFTHSGGESTGNIGATTDNGDGTYTATFTATAAGAATTIHATIGGVNVTTAMPTVTVTP
jgi:hypothetical protein